MWRTLLCLTASSYLNLHQTHHRSTPSQACVLSSSPFHFWGQEKFMLISDTCGHTSLGKWIIIRRRVFRVTSSWLGPPGNWENGMFLCHWVLTPEMWWRHQPHFCSFPRNCGIWSPHFTWWHYVKNTSQQKIIKLLKCLLVEVLILWKKSIYTKRGSFSSVVHDKQVKRKQDAGELKVISFLDVFLMWTNNIVWINIQTVEKLYQVKMKTPFTPSPVLFPFSPVTTGEILV